MLHDLNRSRVAVLVWHRTDPYGDSFVAETQFGDFLLDRTEMNQWTIIMPSDGLSKTKRFLYQAVGIGEYYYRALLELG